MMSEEEEMKQMAGDDERWEEIKVTLADQTGLDIMGGDEGMRWGQTR